MKHRMVTTSLALALACGFALAADVKSGPQVGDKIPGPFNVLNACNAERSTVNGTKTCLV